MSWTYAQKTGELTNPAGSVVGVGYSGNNLGYNSPAYQSADNIGPCPQGLYQIGRAFTHPLAGPITMRLIPDASNKMFGRDGFLMHGDTEAHEEHPSASNSASQGCIVIDRDTRVMVNNSLDKTLKVVSGV